MTFAFIIPISTNRLRGQSPAQEIFKKQVKNQPDKPFQQLALVDTSSCTDVSLEEELRRSRKDGEQAKDYDTIRYYRIDTLLPSKPIIPDESNDDTYTGH